MMPTPPPESEEQPRMPYYRLFADRPIVGTLLEMASLALIHNAYANVDLRAL